MLEVVLEGFFPRASSEESPAKPSRTGLQELGLPYAADPAVTRHVATFLRNHAAEAEEALGATLASPLPRPDAILLNGGVFTPPAVGERLREVVSGWFPGEAPVALLETDALDLTVARGAAWYGLVRRGQAPRIGGGTARAWFVGIDAPGEKTEHLLCVLPRHLEEEVEVEVPRTFALLLERPVRFPLYATTRARAEKPGEVARYDEETFEALPPIQTVLRAPGKGEAPAEVPVRLRASLTEVGTLALWCAAIGSDARWKLEFQLRAAGDEAAPAAPALPRRFGEAQALIERAFGADSARIDKKEVRALPKALEQVLGPRDGWTTPVVRELWKILHAGRAHRRHSPEHERVWFSLTGYALRPGFGAPLDDWRAGETFRLYDEGLRFPDEAATWSAWWILWRRIAGGLNEAAQKRLFDAAVAGLKPSLAGKKGAAKAPGEEEMVRMVGGLERIPVPTKVQAGLWLLERVERERPSAHALWTLGRLGARVPLYGGAEACIPAPQAAGWAKKLLALGNARPEDLVLALAQLARLTGDKARDLEPAVRARVEARLGELKAPEMLRRLVREVVALGSGEEQRVFGESLPPGLRLLPEEPAR